MTAREAESEIKRELGPGERLLWAGVPRPGPVFRRTDITAVPAALVGCGFGLFLTLDMARQRAYPIVAVGVLLAVGFLLLGPGRFFIEAALRSRTAYGVTSRRVVVLRRGRLGRVVSRPLGGLHVDLEAGRRGVGTVWFETSDVRWRALHRGGDHGCEVADGLWFGAAFRLVVDADRVYAVIVKARQDALRQ